jgi:hypothetical protein
MNASAHRTVSFMCLRRFAFCEPVKTESCEKTLLASQNNMNSLPCAANSGSLIEALTSGFSASTRNSRSPLFPGHDDPERQEASIFMLGACGLALPRAIITSPFAMAPYQNWLCCGENREAKIP